MKRWLINLLAVVGTLSLGKYVFSLVRYQLDAKAYLTNCHKVQPGMKLVEVKQLMGDHDKRTNRSKVWTYISNSPTKQYCLAYPSPMLSGEGTNIFFNPETQVVTRVVCGKTKVSK